jgi:hypothetical protein
MGGGNAALLRPLPKRTRRCRSEIRRPRGEATTTPEADLLRRAQMGSPESPRTGGVGGRSLLECGLPAGHVTNTGPWQPDATEGSDERDAIGAMSRAKQ